MALRPETTRVFHRNLYAGMLQTVTLLKRNNDQQEGTVRSVRVFDCRQKKVYKTGEAIQVDMSSDNRCVWQLPLIELVRAGVQYINVIDRIVNTGAAFGVPGTWQPESDTQIVAQLYGNFVNVFCKRIDPPAS